MRKYGFWLLISISILLFPTIGYSQIQLDWASAYPISNSPSNTHIATDRSGNIYVAGNTSDNAYRLIKYNSAGVQQWGFEGYPGSSQEYDGVVGVALDAAGNVYVVNNNSFGVEVDELNGSASQVTHTQLSLSAQYMEARVMTVDLSGNVYIGGMTSSAPSNILKFMTIMVNGGAMRWMSTYEASANEGSWVTGIVADGAGSVYVTGTGYGAHRYGVPKPPVALFRNDTTTDIITIKYDASGNAIWTNTFNGGYAVTDYSYQIIQDPATANLYVTGQSTSGYAATSDLIAYSSAGAQLWAANNANSAYNQGVAVDMAGNILTAGFTNQGNNGINVSKYTSSGSLSWSYSNPTLLLGNTTGWTKFPMAVDRQGNCYLTGSGTTFDGFNTVEISSTGLLVWAGAYPTPQGVPDDALTVFTPVSIFGQIGNPRIIVAGSVYTAGITTLQYENHSVTNAYRPDTLNGGPTGFPDQFNAALSNYPNPFHGSTTILYTLPHNSHVTIQVYDQSGHSLAALFDGDQNAGSYTLPFAASRLVAGIYHYRIIATSPQGNFIQTKQMLIL
jgi:hypothetical protein